MIGLEDMDLSQDSIVPFNLFLMGRSSAIKAANESTILIYDKKLRSPCSKILYYKDSQTPVINPISRDIEYETYGDYFLKNKKLYSYDFSKRRQLDLMLYSDWIDSLPERKKKKAKNLLFARHGLIKDLSGNISVTYPLNTRTKTVILYDKGTEEITDFQERLKEIYKIYSGSWVLFKNEVITDDINVITTLMSFALRKNFYFLTLRRLPTPEEVKELEWIRSANGDGRVKFEVTLEKPKTSVERDFLIYSLFHFLREYKLDISPKISYNLDKIEDKDLKIFFSVLLEWGNEKTRETFHSFAKKRVILWPRFEAIIKTAGIDLPARGVLFYGSG